MKISVSRSVRFFFTAGCVFGVVFMVSYWIYKFTVEDGVVDYESLDKTEIGFPLVSLCFKYPFLGNELKKINQSFSRLSYLQYLKGDIHDDQYEKIDYKNVTMDLDDYFIKSVFKLSNDSTSRTSFAKPAHKVIFNGFYAGKFRKCFETQVDKMETPKLQEITYEYDNTKLLRDLSFPPNRSYELPFNLHHTEQFLVKSSTAQWLYIKHGEEIKIGQVSIIVTGIEFMKRRKKRDQNCSQDSKDFDTLVLRKHIIGNGCRAPYHEPYKKYPVCRNMTKMKQYKYDFDEARKEYYTKPCERFSKVDRIVDSGYSSKVWKLHIVYPEDMKIITQSKEVDGHALIGNIGGYVGLFLGKVFI